MAKTNASPREAPPKSDAYTGLLVISLLALAGGSTLLYLDFSQYSKTKAPPVVTAPPRGGQPPAGQVGGQPGQVQGAMGAQGAMGVQGAMGAQGAMGVMGAGGAMGQVGGMMGAMGGMP